MAYHYALNYQDWLMEYNALADPSTGLRYDKDHVQSSNHVDTTEANGIRRAELREHMKIVEQAAIEADPDLYRFILLGVTMEEATYDILRRKYDMPASRGTFYDRRRKFYWVLWQHIEKFGTKGTI
jgi:hypothetical protein